MFRRPGALDAPCAVSYGPVPGSVYAGHRFLDVLVHGWDLAAATGQDYTLDPELMQACQQIIEPQLDAFRSAGALAPEVAVPADASAQTRFLAMLGRTGRAPTACPQPARHPPGAGLRHVRRDGSRRACSRIIRHADARGRYSRCVISARLERRAQCPRSARNTTY